MSDRVEKKLQEVPVARYDYRHEAEFAAGFLSDAGIPHRLQIDDPILGAAVSTATIWVLGMDLGRAQEVLELDGRKVRLTGSGAPRARRSVRRPTPSSVRAADGPSAGRDGRGRPLLPFIGPLLTVRERALALLGSGGMLATLRLFLWEGVHPIVPGVAAAGAALLAVAGASGWAPGPLRRLLRALSGGAP